MPHLAQSGDSSEDRVETFRDPYKLKPLAHYNVHAGIDDMGIVESLHQVVFHWIIDDIYRRISGPVALPAGAR